MARIWSSGFELNSTANNVEFSVYTESSGPTIQTSTVRSGTYALQSSLVSGAAKYIGYRFDSSTSHTKTIFVRFYLYIGTLPGSNSTVFSIDNSNPDIDSVRLTLKTDGTIQCFRNSLSVGTSSALNTGQWYQIEVKADYTSASGSQVTEFKIDESTVATKTNSNSDTWHNSVTFGGNLKDETATTGQWFFDDIAINDDSGSFQNSWAGEGEIIHLRPDGAGDAANWSLSTGTDHAALVNEVTPDDITSYVFTTTQNQVEEFTLAATPAAIASDDVINCVQVGFRGRRASTESDNVVLRIKAAPSGTVEESAGFTWPNSTPWETNADQVPYNYQLTLYDLPGASTTPWTKADLDTAQIGAKPTGAPTNAIQMTTIWLLVDHKPAAGGGGDLSVSPSDSSSLTESSNLAIAHQAKREPEVTMIPGVKIHDN